ncbi:MAG: hypothetical protein JSS53_05220 [Proteobacteria bacterium]|nr:hypothetical protein [Pseudomonadota bacterium]
MKNEVGNSFTKDTIARRTIEQQMLDTKIMKTTLEEADVSVEARARSGAYLRARSRDGKLLRHAIYIKPDTGLTPTLQYQQGVAVVSRLKLTYDLHPLSLPCIIIKPEDCSDPAWQEQNRLVSPQGEVILEKMIPDEMPPGTVLIKPCTATRLKQKILEIKTSLESEGILLLPETPAVAVPVVAANTSIKTEKDNLALSSIAPNSVFFHGARKRPLDAPPSTTLGNVPKIKRPLN